MSLLRKENLKYFKMAKAIKEGRMHLPKKDLKLFVEYIKQSTTPEIDPIADLRYDITGTGNSSSGIQEPMYLDEDGNEEVNPIARTFNQKGDLDQYVGKFTGLELKPKEIEAVNNYTKSSPTNKSDIENWQKNNANKVLYLKYETTNEFNNTTKTVILKQRSGNDLVFSAYQSTTTPESQNKNTTPEETPVENEIVVSITKTFRDEIEGGKILSELLQKLEI